MKTKKRVVTPLVVSCDVLALLVPLEIVSP
jgi:hypothetical protein